MAFIGRIYFRIRDYCDLVGGEVIEMGNLVANLVEIVDHRWFVEVKSKLKVDLEVQRSSVKQLKADLEVQRASVTELKADLEIERASVTELKADLETERASVMQLKADLETERASVMQLKADLETERVYITQLKERNETSEVDLEALRANLKLYLQTIVKFHDHEELREKKEECTKALKKAFDVQIQQSQAGNAEAEGSLKFFDNIKSNIYAERGSSAGDENRVQGGPENGRNVSTRGEEVLRDKKGKGKLSYTLTIPGSSRGTSVENSLLFEGSINLSPEDSNLNDGMGMMASAGEFDVDDEGEDNGMVDVNIELKMDERVEMDIEVVLSDSEGERRRETRRLSRQRRAALRRAELVQNPNNGAGRNEAALAANRRRALDIARSRAAHFAHFNAPDDVDGPNAVPVPSPSQQDREDWPGPWTVARNLVERRFAAAAARQEAAPPGATRPSLVNWKPSRTPDFTKSRVPPSLHRICLDKLCGDIDHVVSLEGVPDEDKKLIIQGLCALRKITPATTKLCVSASPTEVVIPDWTCLTEEDFIDTLSSRSLERLEALELTVCGRGITDHCLATICAKLA
ncbi:hypothetical protein R1sor_010637 [Riccia sorocarpa]|uniref:Uncharacterized protein n=1 Tax=Riccia sorocarpa TaxID=122646 RepID=A0ABD3I014_9MARC